MELLAPAGNRDALVAAVSHGADAVYLGFTAFSARGSAANFDQDGLAEAVRYAHARGVRVYVTVNTLVKQREMAGVITLLHALCAMGADAVIVQDLGVLTVARQSFPGLAVHASTQMALHNAKGARWAASQGIVRVVAARECGLDSLAAMAREGVEIEAFVHGALCVSVSGQCLFSSMVGGRSGNRGRCAQPCRLPYQWDHAKGALLSPRDQMLMAKLREMKRAGIVSLKIEGRMKRAVYVAAVTEAYHRALDRLENGGDPSPDEGTLRALMQVFHRGGFSEGYVGDTEDAGLLNPDQPGHMGLKIGQIHAVRRDGIAQVMLTDRLNDGDVLTLGGQAMPDTTYAGPNTPASGTALIRFSQPAIKGAEVYRLVDAEQVRASAERTDRAAYPVKMSLYAHPGEKARLTVTDGTHTVTVTGESLVQHAEKRPLTQEDVLAQLGKTGGTLFSLANAAVDTGDAYLPASALNHLRRRALDALTDERITAMRVTPELPMPEESAPVLPAPAMAPLGKAASTDALLIARTQAAEEAAMLLASGADIVEWMPQDLCTPSLDAALNKLDGPIRFVLPPVADDETLDTLAGWLSAHADRFVGVVIANPAHLMLSLSLPLHADAALPVFNTWAAASLHAQGIRSFTVSPELTLAETRAVLAHGGDYTLQAYGRETLMLLSHCPARAALGLGKGRKNCTLCAQGRGILEKPLVDRQGARFPLAGQRMPSGCLVRVYNSVPTDISRHFHKFKGLSAALRLTFTDETRDTRGAIVRLYRTLCDGHPAPAFPYGPTTTAHFFRGVE